MMKPKWKKIYRPRGGARSQGNWEQIRLSPPLCDSSEGWETEETDIPSLLAEPIKQEQLGLTRDRLKMGNNSAPNDQDPM